MNLMEAHEWGQWVQSMTGRVYVTDQDAEEPEDFIVSLTTQVQLRNLTNTHVILWSGKQESRAPM